VVKEPKSPRTMAKEREAGLERPAFPLFKTWLEELEAKEEREEQERLAGPPSPKRSYEPPSEVIPGYLWLSGMPEAKEMHCLPFNVFDVVVYAQSNAQATTPFECNVAHLVYCYDTEDTDITPEFIPTHEFIQSECPLEFIRGKPKKRLLIHCTQGVSRSVSLLAAHLMMQYKCSLRDALLFIKWRRSRASPNRGFIEQLIRFERKLYPAIPKESLTYREAQRMGMVY